MGQCTAGGRGINKFGSMADRKAENRVLQNFFHGIYRMDILRKIAFYDERLARTKDNEMSYRLRSSGYKLYYDPDIVSTSI